MSDHASGATGRHWADEQADGAVAWEQLNALVNRIFRIGLVFEAAASTAEGASAEGLHRVVEVLDVVVHDIRAAVFDELTPASPTVARSGPVSALLVAAAEQMAAAWNLAMVDEQLGGGAAERLIEQIRAVAVDTGSLDGRRIAATSSD